MAFELPAVDAASLAAWCEAHLGSPSESELFRTGHLTCVIGTRLAALVTAAHNELAAPVTSAG